MCDQLHKTCNCIANSSYPSVQQTLDEFDFSRGIWTAALDGSYKEVEDFIERKCVHPDAVDSSGYSALHYASRNGHTRVCELLLRSGASANIQTTSGRVTPLHRAAYCGHLDIVQLLIKHGAKPGIRDSDGKLPLHKAAEKGDLKVTEVLLKESPDSAIVRDIRDRTPLDCVPEHCTDLRQLLDQT